MMYTDDSVKLTYIVGMNSLVEIVLSQDKLMLFLSFFPSDVEYLQMRAV